ncbi:hypothetical protein T439DRAFT_376952 [Meredithblackwellia eburnea MCA 4105]
MSSFNNIQILGGIPIKHQDFAASIVFIVPYCLLLLPIGYRMAASSSRSFTLFRPSLFVLIRIATFLIRIIQSEGNYDIGLFVGEQILLLTGFVLLCEPLVTITAGHISRYTDPKSPRARWTKLIALVLELTLYGAIGLGAAAGSQFGNLDKPSAVNLVKACRLANATISLVVVNIVQISIGFFHFRDNLPGGPSLHILLISWLLAISSVYRIVLYSITNLDPLGSVSKITFYVLFALPELLASAMLVTPNLTKTFALSGVGCDLKGEWEPKENLPLRQSSQV